MLNDPALLKSLSDTELPPVEQWDPAYCGAIDLVIRADGRWDYEGTPIGRRRLQILFSRIIKKENDRYFLVTPVEKVAIKVVWQPFVIVDFDIEEQDGQAIYRLTDNCENQIELNRPGQIQLDNYQGQRLPIVNVRRNLYASFSRSCYYRLLEQAEIVEQHDPHQVQITSKGLTFQLGEFTED